MKYKCIKIILLVLIAFNIINFQNVVHGAVGGQYQTQFDYTYELDDYIEFTFDQKNEVYGSNFAQKIFGSKIRSNFTGTGNMNYFNSNQDLTMAFSFKTQKPDTICHLSTVGTIFGTKYGTNDYSNLWVGYVPVYNNNVNKEYSYKTYEGNATWTKKTVNGFIPSIDDGGMCRVSKKGDSTYYEGATSPTYQEQMTGFELWFSTRSTADGYGWEGDGSKSKYDSSNQYAQSGIQLKFDTEYRVIIRKKGSAVTFDIYDTNDNHLLGNQVYYNVTPHTLYGTSKIQIGGASDDNLTNTTWAYGIQNGYMRELLITRSYLNDEQLKGFQGLDTRYISTFDFYAHLGTQMKLYKNNFGWNFTRKSLNTSYPSTVGTSLKKRAMLLNESINATSSAKMLLTTTGGVPLITKDVIRTSPNNVNGFNQYRIPINDLKDLEQNDLRIQIKSNFEHMWLGYGNTYSPLNLFNSSSSRPYNLLQRVYHNGSTAIWSNSYLYETYPTYNRKGYTIDFTVDQNGNFGFKLPNQYIYSVISAKISENGTFNWSGQDYHNTIKDVRSLEYSKTAFECVSGTGCTSTYDWSNDTSRSSTDFAYTTNVKDFNVGTYRIVHSIKYVNHDEKAKRMKEPTSGYSSEWIFFGNGKKARITYDSSNGLKIEIANAESRWVYGLHQNTPTITDKTNQGGFAIISEDNISKLYVNGYHYDSSRVTYTPTIYQTELYRDNGGSWQFYTSWQDTHSNYVNDGFLSKTNLNTLPNGKYQLKHVATIDKVQHSFVLNQAKINSGWVTIGDSREDDLGKRMARVYSDSSNNMIVEIKDTKGISELDSVVENENSFTLSLHATLGGSGNEEIVNMYKGSNIQAQKLTVIRTDGVKEQTFNSTTRFDEWGATFELTKEFVQNLEIGNYYFEPTTELNSGNGATTSHNTSELNHNLNIPTDAIFVGDKKVQFEKGENGRLELKVEWGVDVTIEKIETYTSLSSEDGKVEVTIGTARDLMFPVKIEIELLYNNQVVNNHSAIITEKEKFYVPIPQEYLEKNTVGEVTANVKLIDMQDSSEDNNTLSVPYHTSTEEELNLEVTEENNKLEYIGIIKTERIFGQEVTEYREKIEIVSPQPLTNKLTYTSFPYEFEINYSNEINQDLNVGKFTTSIPHRLLDNYLEFSKFDGNVIVDMELKSSTSTQNIYQLPTVFYELKTGFLFNQSDDSRITDTITRSNEWFIPLNAPLQTYDLISMIEKVGTNMVNVKVNNQLEVTKDFISNPNPEDENKWKNGQIYIREVSPLNPFPSDVPSNWEDKLDFFEKK